MLQQYFRVKAEHPNVLLAMQVGDFYEFYGEDAEIAARELEIALTGREDGRNGRVAMAGVPIHAVERYMARLVQKGFKVAVCDQIEDPKFAKGLVKRRVTRVLTPGTVLEDSMLDAKSNNYLVAAVIGDPVHGIGVADVSTGEFLTTEISGEHRFEKLLDEIFRLEPAEILVPEEDLELIQTLKEQTRASITPINLKEHLGRGAREILIHHFETENLRGFGCEDYTRGLDAAALVLRYLQQNEMKVLSHIRSLSTYSVERFMYLDSTARRHLEQSLSDGSRRHTLLGVLDMTRTPMGARLLKRWLDEPLLEVDRINERLDAVGTFMRDTIHREELRERLRKMADIERLVARAATGTANARDLVALRQSLHLLPDILANLQAVLEFGKQDSDSTEAALQSSRIEALLHAIRPLDSLTELLDRALTDEPPAAVKEGGLIRDGYDPELDKLRRMTTDGKSWIARLEAQERQSTNISSLKIGYNAVFGYYIEVSKTHLAKVPSHYIRKQTTSNAERYFTPELKEQEAMLLGAEERILALEYELFSRVRDETARSASEVLAVARALAELDVMFTFAEVAARQRYARPAMEVSNRIEILGGRHPVVERFSETPFVPNDCLLNDSEQRLIILTGPNMSGKCVTGDTLVFTENGLAYLRDLMPPDAPEGEFTPLNCRVQAHTQARRATHFYRGGRQATLRIKTRLGFELEGTPEHRVWVRCSDGMEDWKRLAELQVGDTVAIGTQIDLWGCQTMLDIELPPSAHRLTKHYTLPREMSEDLAYLMGLLIGDGTLTYREAVYLSTADAFIAEEFVRIMYDLFGYAVKCKRNGKDYFVSSLQIRRFLEALGLGYDSASEKYVPAAILKSPKKYVTAFLQGLFDTDGYANKKGNVFYTTTSKRLAREIQLLLLNLGIVAGVRPKKTLSKTAYDVSIYGIDAIRFYEHVGFRLPRKQERSRLLSDIRMPNVGGIPHLQNLLEAIQARIVAKWDKPIALKRNKSVESIFYTYLPGKRNISYAKMAELIAYCHQNGVDCYELETLYTQHYFYEPVVLIEPGEVEVYDLSVEREHAYIAGGLVSHNSTYIRQTALTVIMAQIGSFVPADKAEIGIVDRIFTRVGARDELATGQSTFMVEMSETANILNNATMHSLVILDEIGRGTSTYDGLAIAWAVTEYLHAIGCKTLFATHYHYLNELANRLEGVVNYRVAVKEQGDRVIWLHKVLPGGTDRSYGIQVARMAGVPPEVINRARAQQILSEFEKRGATQPAAPPSSDAPSIQHKKLQMTLFEAEPHPVLEELKKMDVTALTPVEALMKLDELKRKV